MTYIIPQDLIDDINEINNRTQLMAIPYSVDDFTTVVEIPSGWIEHEAFATEHNLQPYQPQE